jgi:hypothetical protein
MFGAHKSKAYMVHPARSTFFSFVFLSGLLSYPAYFYFCNMNGNNNTQKRINLLSDEVASFLARLISQRLTSFMFQGTIPWADFIRDLDELPVEAIHLTSSEVYLGDIFCRTKHLLKEKGYDLMHIQVDLDPRFPKRRNIIYSAKVARRPSALLVWVGVFSAVIACYFAVSALKVSFFADARDVIFV